MSPRPLFKIRGVQFVRPWLPTTHPQFFFIYRWTMAYHLVCGVMLLVPGGDSNPAIRPHATGETALMYLMSLAIGAGMYVGLHLTTFTVSRVCLALGFIWAGMRLALVSVAWLQGVPTALSIPNLGLIVALHVSQAREPPANPLSAQQRAGS